MYLKGVKLRDLWDRFKREHPSAAAVIKPEFLLKVIALCQDKEPRKSTLLDVIDQFDKLDFEREWAAAGRYVGEAYKRVAAPEGGYGAFDPDWIPYSTLIVPLAALLRVVQESKGGEEMYRKVDRWYWSNVFTQRYDSAVDTKAHSDLRELKAWLKSGPAPTWISDVSADTIDLEVDEPRSALYRGLMCLVVLEGARDFINGQAANLEDCQDNHIFPRSKFGKAHDVNMILNRTLISSNQVKGDKKPSVFLPLVLEKHGGSWDRLQKTLSSHLIPVAGLEALKRDDFGAFVEARRGEFVERLRQRLS